jgi:hypothetical protein
VGTIQGFRLQMAIQELPTVVYLLPFYLLERFLAQQRHKPQPLTRLTFFTFLDLIVTFPYPQGGVRVPP